MGISQREDILFLAQGIEQLAPDCFKEMGCQTVLDLCVWAMERLELYEQQGEFGLFYRKLLELAPVAEQNSLNSSQCKELLDAMKALQKEWLQTVSLVVYYSQKAQEEGLLLCEKLAAGAIPFRKGMVLPTEEPNPSVLRILLAGENEEVSVDGMDFYFTKNEFLTHAMSCNPRNIFDYDRIYLLGKLNRVAQCPETRIFIAGSSYAMVGVIEERMPRPAVNAAINAQDPYYSLLCVRKAVEVRPELDTIVMPLAYYFFFSDLSDHPSDYSLSVLSFVEVPVFQDRHGYGGALKTAPLGEEPDPVMDAIYPIRALRQQILDGLSTQLAQYPYFNDSYNPRPVGGMLRYRFMEKSDEQNFKGGAIRAQAHNQNYHMGHGRKNLRLLEEFLSEMEQQGRKVILFVPPVTDFYRHSVSREMQESYYQMVNPVVQRHACVFLDLFDSPEFDRTDFQDYDHLNAKGAEKLSRLLAEHCKEGDAR